MREWKFGIVKYCVTKVPGCVLSQQLIPFLYFLEHAQCLPPCAPSAGPPRSLFLSAWPAQRWLSIDYRTCTHTYIDTLPLTVSLWGLGRLCSHGFPFLFIVPVICYEDLQMCLDSCFLFSCFTLNESLQTGATFKLWVKTKRLIQFCVSFLNPYRGPLTSTRCFVIVFLFC